MWRILALWLVQFLFLSPPAPAQTPPMGSLLLHKSSANGRYFATPDGRIRYLSGGYEGSEFQDYVFGGGTTSDFQTALDILSRHGGNLLRLWTSESSTGNPAE